MSTYCIPKPGYGYDVDESGSSIWAGYGAVRADALLLPLFLGPERKGERAQPTHATFYVRSRFPRSPDLGPWVDFAGLLEHLGEPWPSKGVAADQGLEPNTACDNPSVARHVVRRQDIEAFSRAMTQGASVSDALAAMAHRIDGDRAWKSSRGSPRQLFNTHGGTDGVFGYTEYDSASNRRYVMELIKAHRANEAAAKVAIAKLPRPLWLQLLAKVLPSDAYIIGLAGVAPRKNMRGSVSSANTGAAPSARTAPARPTAPHLVTQSGPVRDRGAAPSTAELVPASSVVPLLALGAAAALAWRFWPASKG